MGKTIDKLLGRKDLKARIAFLENYIKKHGEEMEKGYEEYSEKVEELSEAKETMRELREKLEMVERGTKALEYWIKTLLPSDCETKLEFQYHGFRIYITPSSYRHIMFPRITLSDTDFSNSPRNLIVDLTDNPVLNDVFKDGLAKLYKGNMKTYKEDVYISYMGIGEVPEVIKIYEESLAKYNKIISK